MRSSGTCIAAWTRARSLRARSSSASSSPTSADARASGSCCCAAPRCRCAPTNPGFPDALRVRAHVRTLTAWWRGDLSLSDARSAGMTVEGPRELVRAFPRWFERYVFAEIAPVAAP